MKKKNNKKSLIIVFSIIGAYLVLSIVLFGWDNFMNKFQGVYLMLDPNTKWQLKDGKWLDVKNEKKYNWQKFDVYINNKLLGNYNLLYNNKWYLFDEKRESQQYEGSFLAIKGNKRYKVVDFQEDDIDEIDKQLFKAILEENKIIYPNEFTYSKKVLIDLDGDDNPETIYTISNAFTYEDIDKKFSFVFIKDDEVQILYKGIESIERQYHLCVPKVKNIIDIDNNSKYEIIIECNYFNLLGTCNSLYQQKNGVYKIAKGC